jgi:RNA polymerase sigma-B factor
VSVSEAPPRDHGISLEARADQRLFARLHDEKDPVTQEILVERFLPLARSVARAHASNGDTYDDVFQVASLALVKAIARFDPDRSVAFSSFAVPTMVGEIKRYFRDRTWTVRPPRGLQEMTIRVNRLVETWTARYGESPTVIDIVEALQIGIEDVLEALQAGQARISVSLDLPAGAGDGTDRVSLGELVPDDEEGYARVERTEVLNSVLRHLCARDQDIVRLRFLDDLTQSEIGRRHGLSQMQVSRILRASLDRMRYIAQARSAEPPGVPSPRRPAVSRLEQPGQAN